jgi:hypothetical protein
MSETRFRQAFLILPALTYPVYQWVLGRLGGRKALAAIETLMLLLVLVMAPLLAVLGAGATESASPRPSGRAFSSSSISPASSTPDCEHFLATIASSRTGRNVRYGKDRFSFSAIISSIRAMPNASGSSG